MCKMGQLPNSTQKMRTLVQVRLKFCSGRHKSCLFSDYLVSWIQYLGAERPNSFEPCVHFLVVFLELSHLTRDLIVFDFDLVMIFEKMLP
jgi:hypothetical protein